MREGGRREEARGRREEEEARGRREELGREGGGGRAMHVHDIYSQGRLRMSVPWLPTGGRKRRREVSHKERAGGENRGEEED